MRNELVKDLPFKDYLAAPGWNPSTLARGLKSMLHLKTPPVERKPQRNQLVGSIAHCKALEHGSSFDDRYVVWDGARRQGKEYDALLEEHPGKEIVKVDEYDQACRVAEAVLEDGIARELFEQVEKEVSLFVHDMAHQCKGRPDGLGGGILVDLKTTTNVSSSSFGRVCAALSYAHRLACYKRWAELLGVTVAEVFLVAVETTEDMDVAVYRLDQVVLENAWNRMERILQRIHECERREYWPGVAEGEIQELEVPLWSMSESDVLDWSE